LHYPSEPLDWQRLAEPVPPYGHQDKPEKNMGLSISYELEMKGTKAEAEAVLGQWRRALADRHPEAQVEPVTGERFGFLVRPGAGAEMARFTLRWEEGAWRGGDSPKTQYASLPQNGGNANFLKVHLLLIDILDTGCQLGIVTRVVDDGNYHETRNQEMLLQNLYLNQAAVAQLVGMLKDNFERDQFESPITAHPHFERLEAVGALLT
jgi:hypothetical protein